VKAEPHDFGLVAALDQAGFLYDDEAHPIPAQVFAGLQRAGSGVDSGDVCTVAGRDKRRQSRYHSRRRAR